MNNGERAMCQLCRPACLLQEQQGCWVPLPFRPPQPQASVLKLWSEDQSEGREASKEACRAMAAALARANGQAVQGRYEGPHPSITSSQGSLRESFRGWRTDV